MNIAPGADLLVTITAVPRRAAAKKTLYRICQKDPAIARRHRQQKAKRPSWQDWTRGGRFWHHQMKSKPSAALEPGRTYNIRATLDVIRDLASVKDCVKVTVRK